MLELRQVGVRYGEIAAVHDFSASFATGEISTIIGSNGAGKTTLLRAISGLVPVSRGEIHFDGARLDSLSPAEIVLRGIAHVPEGRRVFPDLTVEENMRIGAFRRRDRAGINRDFDMLCSEFPRLAERRKQWASTLSGGEQQMLAIARAVMAAPRLILLDEPSMGLSPIMVSTMAEVIVRLNRNGKTVLLVEQNANVALSIAHRALVLEQGRVVLAGTGAELKDNQAVREAYVGI